MGEMSADNAKQQPNEAPARQAETRNRTPKTGKPDKGQPAGGRSRGQLHGRAEPNGGGSMGGE